MIRATKREEGISAQACWTLLVLALAAARPAQGQSAEPGAARLSVTRPISFGIDKDYAVLVTQFFHHGQISPDGRNVVVFTKDRKPVPCRVLQLGPGDFCRLAFQPLAQQRNYEICYGSTPSAETDRPVWREKSGLLLETREYRQCNLNSFDSVRKAFESSTPIGSDYVDTIRHAYNPFSLKNEPFLSRYSGYFRVATGGSYGFFLSSQDCSFLVIDDKVVAEAPGRHPPLRRAIPSQRADVKLTAGMHKLEFYHAAAGPAAMMTLSWESLPADAKTRPELLPSAAFGAAAIGRVPAGPPSLKEGGFLPDFMVAILGDVPLPDNPLPLIGVRYVDTSSKSLSSQARLLWDFGDGQTSNEPDPNHVYLTPGLYTVKLTVTRSGRDHVAQNRVYIDQPRVLPLDKPHQLDQYLPILRGYDPQTLSAAALKQLVLAFRAKADRLLSPEPGELEAAAALPPKPSAKGKGQPAKVERAPSAEAIKKLEVQRKAEAAEYVALAVNSGKARLVAPSAAGEQGDLVELARLIGPMARNQMGDSLLAGQIWRGAGQKMTNPQWSAECQIEAADIALNDLLNRTAAKGFLEAASAKLRGPKPGPVASRLKRVWGDYYAASGDGKAARAAYEEAERVLGSARTQIERIAWQGAHSRSAEQFLKSGEYDRAAAELRAWQDEFPGDKMGGYLHLLFARYWEGRRLYAQAVTLADQLLAVSPDSPYIDQLLMLAADCEAKRGRADRALATLHALVHDYPGSPLAPQAKEKIAKLQTRAKKR
jgi:PKD repeat protein